VELPGNPQISRDHL